MLTISINPNIIKNYRDEMDAEIESLIGDIVGDVNHEIEYNSSIDGVSIAPDDTNLSDDIASALSNFETVLEFEELDSTPAQL